MSGSTGVILKTITAIPEVVRKLVLSPDESVLYVLGASEYVYEVNIASGVATAKSTFPNLVQDLALSPEGTALYVSVYPHQIYALQSSDLKQKWSVSNVTAGLLSVSHDGNSLYVSGGVIGPNASYLVEIDTPTQSIKKISLGNNNESELFAVVPSKGHYAVVFSVGFSKVNPYPPQTFSAGFLNTETNEVAGVYLAPISSGYVPGFQRHNAFFVPIQFAPNGESVWMLTTCMDATKCVLASWQLEGFTFPGGKLIASTPLAGVVNVIGMPR